jgi:DNA-binding SARP family transcriptional activator
LRNRPLLSVNGSFELCAGSPLHTLRVSTKKGEALLTYLALTRAAVRRDTLCGLLWGDVPAAQSRHSLRQALTEIRSALRAYGQHFIETVGDRVALKPNAIRVDVLLLERLLKRGSLRALRLAVTLSRGDLLDGVAVREPEFERWLMTARARVRQLTIEAHERYGDALIASGKYSEAIHTALRLVELDPLHERGHRTLMALYAAQGQRTAALRQYDICARYLARELGVSPAPEMEKARQELLSRPSECDESERRARPRTRRKKA